MKQKTQHAGYWLGQGWEDVNLEERGSSTSTIIKLAAIKQSITNFVRIVTGKNIPVKYSSGRDSYTEGTQVVISASTKDKNFDAVVGLALHEASHIKLTDFTFLRGYSGDRKQGLTGYGQHMLPASLIKAAERVFPELEKDSHEKVVKVTQGVIKELMNIVEDRRIDYFIYRTAPGYRPYYESLYDHYFRNRQIDIALKTGVMAKPTVDNYLFYITNSANRFLNKSDLPNLDKVLDLFGMDTIARLDNDDFTYVRQQIARRSTDYNFHKMPEIFRVCCQIAELIFANSDPVKSSQQPQYGQMGDQSNDEGDENKEDNMDMPRGSMGAGSSGTSSQDNDEDEEDDSDSDDGDDESDEGDEGSNEDGEGEGSDSESDKKSGKGKGSSKSSDSDDDSDEDSEGDADGDSDKDSDSSKDSDKDSKDSGKKNDKPQPKVNKARLKKAIKQQKDFLNGNLKKKKISNKTDQQVTALEQAGASVTEVDHSSQYGGKATTRVLVMRKLTKEIMESGAFPFTPGAYYHRGHGSASKVRLSKDSYSEQAVKDGLRAGAILAQRLSIRNQSQVTKFNRKDQGHLDKRRLSALGFDDDKVFYNLRIAAFRPVFVHMTLDCSGSMNGERWQKALMVGVALAVAAEKIGNLNFVLSMRAGEGEFATIAIIYDSRTDKVTKIKQLFPYLTTSGSTPEGLCFSAIMNEILNVKADERFFINMSDGEPAWTNYGGEPAWRHTREQVNMIRGEGIKVLSYFVGDGSRYSSVYGGGSRRAFEVMYGKDASFITVTQVPSLVNTLNKLFLTR